MNIVSWNCRGLGSKKKEEAMRSLIRIETPDILLILETKLEEKVFLQVSSNLWRKSGGRAVSARGASGGLGALGMKPSWNWSMEREKKQCWDSIKLMAEEEALGNIIIVGDLNMGNIIIVGDLNITLSSSEKRGGSIVRDPAREWVEDVMQDWDLLDIKPLKGKHTWSNKRVGPGHIAT
eukprot:PITA_09526